MLLGLGILSEIVHLLGLQKRRLKRIRTAGLAKVYF